MRSRLDNCAGFSLKRQSKFSRFVRAPPLRQKEGTEGRFLSGLVESGRQTIGDYYKKVLQLQITRWNGKLVVVVDQIFFSSFPFFFQLDDLCGNFYFYSVIQSRKNVREEESRVFIRLYFNRAIKFLHFSLLHWMLCNSSNKFYFIYL